MKLKSVYIKRYFSAKALTEAKEARSHSIAVIYMNNQINIIFLFNTLWIRSFPVSACNCWTTSLHFFISLPITKTCAPTFANTLAVSLPIPFSKC